MINTIREAIAVLARSGWTKGTFRDEESRLCLQGALYEVHGLMPACERPMLGPLSDELARDVALVNRVLEEQYPERFGAVGVSRFNDHPDTTLDDILRVLDKAAVAKDELL